ncbi:hypothetical protein FD06_GL000723 [Apilactobacillus ozensis DSM 23829 = JCM 17196]|uniref:SH3b domain-containing protein n=1 Tax=Apilactobacillus ozensis DSM 23829 = JCM 17196 TaxID=1423781 RepID=A0A0R2APA8_9LACO|nr:hypothetical protein [Apilactobacillus ozensis]KRM67572.1 hypothetical protein FD06_GL000723 [Apilactobacillus ozensis DSM 23829 = JCM 17196]
MKKLLIGLVCLLSLTMMAMRTSVSASSKPGFNSSYWNKARTVKVTKQVKAQLVTLKNGSWANNTTILKTKLLRKGSIIKVQNGGASWGWIITGNGFKHSHKSFWEMSKQLNTKWFNVVK